MAHRTWTLTGALAVLALTGCSPPPPADPPAALVTTWKPIASWTGVGNRQSETFTMLRHGWRVRWEATAEADAAPGSLRVTVHSADSGRVLAEPVDRQGPGSGVVELVEEPRQFYLTFESAGVAWTVSVDERIDEDGPVAQD